MYLSRLTLDPNCLISKTFQYRLYGMYVNLLIKPEDDKRSRNPFYSLKHMSTAVGLE